MLDSFRKAQDRLLPPILFLAVCLPSFGLLIPWLGYYLDDWIIVNAYNLGGIQRVFEYAFIGNRPLVFWMWSIGLELFGSDAASWQIWTLFWRWLTVVIFWMGWREIWPDAIRPVTLAAVLFAVYPLFRQQASALTFSFHWMSFFLYGLSIYLMIRAVRRPARFTPYMLGSLLAAAVQLFSQEFFIGVELMRPAVLWLAMRPIIPEKRERIKRVLLTWAPYLVLMAGYLYWRVGLMPTLGSDRNTPYMVLRLFSSPLDAIGKLVVFFLQDSVEALLGVWYQAIQPGLLGVAPFSGMVAWVVAFLVFLLMLAFCWRGFREKEIPAQTPAEPWYVSAIPFGFAAMILGFSPGWAIGRHIYDLSGIYNDRFGLAATFGAALLVVALLDMLLKKPAYFLTAACLLIVLGAGQNFRFANNYRLSWEKQSQLYWQLYWRAPSLKAPTAIIGDGALISYMGSWASVSALVQMYAPTKDSRFVDYWYFDATRGNLGDADNLPANLADDRNFLHYRAPARDSLVIAFEPENQRCLWVLSELDKKNRYLTDTLQQVLPLSNLDRISAGSKSTLQADIFGPEIRHDWCYYFQKGDLAAQFQDWGTAVNLWHEAEKARKHPYNGVEYRPFIEGFAHTGDWETAIALTQKAYLPGYEMRDLLCQTWQRIASTTDDTPEKMAALPEVIDRFRCKDELGDLVGE